MIIFFVPLIPFSIEKEKYTISVKLTYHLSTIIDQILIFHLQISLMDDLGEKFPMNIPVTLNGNGTLSVTEYFNISGTSPQSEAGGSLSLPEIIIMGTLFVCFR